MKRVRVLCDFRDSTINLAVRKAGDEFVCDNERADKLINIRYAELIEDVIEKKTPVEKAIKEEKKEKAVTEKANKPKEVIKKVLNKNAKK